MKNRYFLAAAGAAIALVTAGAAQAQDVKIGFILPMTGPQQSTGVQEAAAAKLYMAQHGDTVAGKKVELIIKDDGAVPDNTKRIAQELIVNDKVTFLAGFGITPTALAVAPLATEAKTPEIVTAAGTSIITEKSPYIVRTSFTLAQSTVPMADWAAQNGIKKVVSMVSDYAPGADAAKSFARNSPPRAARLSKASPFLSPIRISRRSCNAPPTINPTPSSSSFPPARAAFSSSSSSRKASIRPASRSSAPATSPTTTCSTAWATRFIGTVTAHFYSADHNSAANKAFVAAFEKANGGKRPNFMAVGGYDGMHLMYAALQKTGGKTDGDSLIAAMKGMAWESPRGPISIDPETRDIIQNVYIRKVEKKNGQLYNVEFATFPNVKDPMKAAEKK